MATGQQPSMTFVRGVTGRLVESSPGS